MLVGLLWDFSKAQPGVATTMGLIKIERIGGVGGFGGPHLKSFGERDFAELSVADRAALNSLFSCREGKLNLPRNMQMRDGFSYRISRETEAGIETIVVPESMVPAVLISSIKDTIE